jgi:glutaconate CoA-transferase subunit B
MTDLGVLEPDPDTCELTLVVLHPGATADEARESTGWELRVADDVVAGDPPTPEELDVLRSLKTIDEDVGS